MNDKDSKIWNHYQKLQESLSDLMSPTFGTISRSLTYITLNQTYTHAERLFELVEESPTLSGPRQALMAKLAHYIESCKEHGMRPEFLIFIKKDLGASLSFIRNEHAKEFDLAS
ncbi:MAG: hypothetical protein H7249_10210 [Chitinophagaceae bacterium]|nr:hypothetical protein [Oligoflexus sp.]